MDRRIKRTRTAIFNAVLELLVEKESNKITVLELCKKADINKSTFYLHYNSIDDCMQSCFKIVMDGVIDLSKHINYYEMLRNPKPTVDALLSEVEKSISYVNKFKESTICGPSIKILKDSLVSNIAENSGFTPQENYAEIANIAFCVGGFADAIMQQLPIFDKEKLSKVVCDFIIG